MPASIDLNADIGESLGAWKLGQDDELMPLLSSANLACGFHAGDPQTLQKTVALAATHGVAIGAHPGFPDLVGFGRRDLTTTPAEVYADTLYQLGGLGAFVQVAGQSLHHVKAHGALYLKLHRHAPTARAFAEAVRDWDNTLPVVLLAGPGGEMAVRETERVGLRGVLEAFPDRAYDASGHLLPRGETGAVLHDPQEIARRALQIAHKGIVEAVDGEFIPLQAQTLCLHGDNPAATEAARAVQTALRVSGVVVRTF